MINRYSHFLFDADETLFKFDAFAGLQHMFQQFDVYFDVAHFEAYQKLNKPLWVQYQNGDISAETLQITRFEYWANTLNVSAKHLNERFLNSMALICEPLAGAKELIEHLLAQQKSLTIVTNGFTALQQKRLKATGLESAFEHIVISEQIGWAKPNVKVFEHTLDLLGLGSDDKAKVMMIGDTLESDIQGGINAGIDTCWLNHNNASHQGIKPTYSVTNLNQLLDMLKQKNPTRLD